MHCEKKRIFADVNNYETNHNVMKKNVLILIIVAASAIVAHAQNPVPLEITYDAAGNSIARKVMQLSFATGMNNNSDTTYYVDQLQTVQLKIYPNPTKGKISVDINGLDDRTERNIRIFDFQGRILYEKSSTEQHLDIDLSAYPTGNYIIEVVANNEHTTWKVIKE